MVKISTEESSMVRVVAVFLLCVTVLCGQQYVIFTIAGGAPPVTPAPAAGSSVGDPPRGAVDSAGNLYFGSDHSIFKVDSSGTLFGSIFLLLMLFARNCLEKVCSGEHFLLFRE